MSGEKLDPIAIGHFKNPRCFKNIINLPIKYYSNKTAWMTSKIFHDYIINLNQKFKNNNKKNYNVFRQLFCS